MYNTTYKTMQFCDGTIWWEMKAIGGGGGSSVWTKGEGDTIYFNSGTEKVGIGITVPTEALHVDGNILATGAITGSAPVASTDMANKDYVDTAVAAATSGVGGPVCGLTRSVFTGNLGGWSGADAKCVADFGSGWRFATAGNISGGIGVPGEVGWGSVYRYGSNGQCVDWTNGTASYNGTRIGATSGVLGVASVSCGDQNPVWCCNF